MGETRTSGKGARTGPESRRRSAAAPEPSPASDGKAPRTARGERTLRKILDAALEEFGEKGFSDGSIVGITSRARVALGTFYTYFDSKEAVFQELVRDMSAQVRDHVAPALEHATDALDGERRALQSFLDFVATHRQVYRIIDEAEFVEAWAIMGMNVFLGLRFGVWDKRDPAELTRIANRLIRRGLEP